MSARIDALPNSPRTATRSRSIFADAQQLPFDGEGRIILPELLCQHAGITETATFVGLGRTFQVWEPQHFEKHQQEMRERARRQGATVPSLQAARPAPGEPA